MPSMREEKREILVTNKRRRGNETETDGEEDSG